MNLKEIDPIDFAGAVGHAAAAQFYVLLTGDDSQNWPGCYMEAKDDTNLPQVVDLLARYVVQRGAEGAQLYTHARLEGMTAHPGVTEAPPSIAACYDLFARSTLNAHAFLQTLIALLDAAEKPAPSNPPMKIEDSIFAPSKPLDYMEPHQEAHLAALGAALAAPSIEREARTIAIGESLNFPAGSEMPATISIGTRGDENHAQGTAAEGQETRDPGTHAGKAPPAVRTDGAAGSGAPDAGSKDDASADAAGETGTPAAVPADDGAAQDLSLIHI